MFTERTMAIVERAKGRASLFGRTRVDLESVLAAIGADAEAGVRLADCLTAGDIANARGSGVLLSAREECMKLALGQPTALGLPGAFD